MEGEASCIGKGFLDSSLGNTRYYIPLLRFLLVSIFRTERSDCKRTHSILLHSVFLKLTQTPNSFLPYNA